jgi:hypothetical protein
MKKSHTESRAERWRKTHPHFNTEILYFHESTNPIFGINQFEPELLALHLK